MWWAAVIVGSRDVEQRLWLEAGMVSSGCDGKQIW